MKAAIYPGEGRPVAIETIADPEPGPNDLLITRPPLRHLRHRPVDDQGRDVGLRRRRPVRPRICRRDRSRVGKRRGGLSGRRAHRRAAVGRLRPLRGLPGARQQRAVPGKPGVCDRWASPSWRRSSGKRRACALPSTLSMADGALIEPLAVSLYGVKLARIAAGRPGAGAGRRHGRALCDLLGAAARRGRDRRHVALRRGGATLCLAMGADAFVAYGDNEIGEVDRGARRRAASSSSNASAPKACWQGGDACRAVRQDRLAGLLHRARPGACRRSASYKCVSMQFAVGYTMQRVPLSSPTRWTRATVDPKAIITNTHPADRACRRCSTRCADRTRKPRCTSRSPEFGVRTVGGRRERY